MLNVTTLTNVLLKQIDMSVKGVHLQWFLNAEYGW